MTHRSTNSSYIIIRGKPIVEANHKSRVVDPSLEYSTIFGRVGSPDWSGKPGHMRAPISTWSQKIRNFGPFWSFLRLGNI